MAVLLPSTGMPRNLVTSVWANAVIDRMNAHTSDKVFFIVVFVLFGFSVPLRPVLCLRKEAWHCYVPRLKVQALRKPKSTDMVITAHAYDVGTVMPSLVDFRV